MAEEEKSENSKSTDTEGLAKRSIIKTIFIIIFKLLKYGFYIFAIVLFIYLLWSVALFVYDRTIANNANETGTKDYYAKIEKQEPLETHKLPSMRIRLEPKNSREMGGLVSLGVVLAFDSANEALKSEIEMREVQINDMLRQIMINKVFRDLQDNNRLSELKMEMKNSINSILVNGELVEIYFEDFNLIARP